MKLFLTLLLAQRGVNARTYSTMVSRDPTSGLLEDQSTEAGACIEVRSGPPVESTLNSTVTQFATDKRSSTAKEVIKSGLSGTGK